MIVCESCGYEMEGKTCLSCERECPEDALYCCYCGEPFPLDSLDSLSEDDAYVSEERILCSDESCIGILDEDGVCTECGRVHKIK